MSVVRVLRVLRILAALALIGAVVVVLGLIPFRASSGHFDVTRWFLRFTRERSVETHSLGTEVPRLDDVGLLVRGATHYQTACRPCHGAPGEEQGTVTAGMTPRPPRFPDRLETEEPEDLFYLVKHGVKFTGMPAWPTLRRDDEVWAMVALLGVLPGLTPTEYRRLAFGGVDPTPWSQPEPLEEVPRPVLETCARCHGEDGGGRPGSAIPALAGQSAPYLAAALRAFAEGRRFSGTMQMVAAALEPEAVDEVAAWYAALPTQPRVGGPSAAAASIARGEGIALGGIPEERVPACVVCHGPGGDARNPRFPRLAGQPAEYLALQLRLFAQGNRGGSEYAHIMRLVAARLGPDDVADVAAWYATRDP